MSNDRRTEVEAFLARILGGNQMPESPLPKAAPASETTAEDGLNDENPYQTYEYFIFYVITTPKGPVLGNTVAGTRQALSSKNFDSLRRGLVQEYMKDTGVTGLTEDELTIVTIAPL